MECEVLSPWDVVKVFNSQQAADRYGSCFNDTAADRRRDRREKRCISAALAEVPRGGRVLDLPCGAGRIYPLLKGLGLKVVSADSSPYMVEIARKRAAAMTCAAALQGDSFCVENILGTRFHDKQFDAVVCNRLFHHFADSCVRQKALCELARICSGPIVVSFFSCLATDALTFYRKKYILRYPIRDRIPISPLTFARDIRAAGLRIVAWRMARPLVSKQWYVVLRTA